MPTGCTGPPSWLPAWVLYDLKAVAVFSGGPCGYEEVVEGTLGGWWGFSVGLVKVSENLVFQNILLMAEIWLTTWDV